MKTTWSIGRRHFLRGVAGAMMPLPFLNIMEKAVAKSIPGESAAPLRFMALFKPNGAHPPSWNISGGTEFDFRMSPMMAPFAKHRDDLLILDNMGDFGFSSHSNAARRFLAGRGDNKHTATVDQFIADQIGGQTPTRSLELTTEGLFALQIDCSYISYDKNGAAIPRESDPQLVFDRLFRNPMSDPRERRRMTSLLDRVADDARALQRKTSHADDETLDEYFTVIRETEKRLEAMEKKDKESSALRGEVDLAGLQRPRLAGNLNEQVETMIDLIAMAMWTDQTRCVTYMLGNSNSRMVFDFLGVKEQHHYLSHFFRNFSRENLDALLKINYWHMEKFDYLLNRMKSWKDQNGSLLDHSVVLFGGGMGHSDNHTAQRIPTILAGKGGGRLKTGRYLRFSKNQDLSRLHLALMHQFGINIEEYGGADTPLPGLDGGPYDEYEEQAFNSWSRLEGRRMTVQGRLRMSDNLDEAKVFFLDVEGEDPVRIEVDFNDFRNFNLPYHVGTPIHLVGNVTTKENRPVITQITGLTSLFGKSNPNLRSNQ